jgi:hypothetical protein
VPCIAGPIVNRTPSRPGCSTHTSLVKQQKRNRHTVVGGVAGAGAGSNPARTPSNQQAPGNKSCMERPRRGQTKSKERPRGETARKRAQDRGGEGQPLKEKAAVKRASRRQASCPQPAVSAQPTHTQPKAEQPQGDRQQTTQQRKAASQRQGVPPQHWPPPTAPTASRV